MPSCVLVVDDSEIDRYILSRQISDIENVHIVECTDGTEALSYLEKGLTNQVQIPKAIVLDVNMPTMGGFEFLETLQKLDNQSALNFAIFMYSSSDRQEDIDKAMSFGLVQGYLVKGETTPEVLRDKMGSVLCN